MRLSTIATLTGTFGTAAAVALVSAYFAAGAIERASARIVEMALGRAGLDWAQVDTSGLQVFLYGTAPDEAERFNALSVAGTEVDTARLIDQMLVAEAATIAPPQFSLEVLRSEAGLSLIGLIPATTDRDDLIRRLSRAAGAEAVSDFLEVADYPAPEGWDDALAFARQALEELPRSKISVTQEGVAVKAVVDDASALRRMETNLTRAAPQDLTLRLDLTAPRPVIAPFTIRFTSEDGEVRLSPCDVDGEEALAAIQSAASAAGLDGKASCRLGLGVPTPNWGDAAVEGIAAVAALGGGVMTLTNLDMRVVAPAGMNAARFDAVIGDLTDALPPEFALASTLPPPPPAPDAEGEGEEEIPEFTVTLSPEGTVQMRGELTDPRARETTNSLALAAFGTDGVRMAARIAEDLPVDWPLRTMAAVEALALLESGAASVTPDRITVSGRTGDQGAAASVSNLLSGLLGDAVRYDLDIEYLERLDPASLIPTAEECAEGITAIIGDRKITFEPGSATLDASADAILDELAELLRQCGDMRLEIGGHTDSQGREIMNQQLSQERAQSVLDALRDRLVPVRGYTVVGYGETQPIADNDTEEGREINRRIEFRLKQPETETAEESTLDTIAAQSDPDEAAEDTTANPDAPSDAEADGDEADGDGNSDEATDPEAAPSQETTEEAEE